MNMVRGLIVFLSFVAVFIFFVEPAMAVDVNVQINKSGTGRGNFTFSATSSPEYEFRGWSGDVSCIGIGECAVEGHNKLLPAGSSKTVIASFGAPACEGFTYTAFGSCQLDGTRRRAITSAIPDGCDAGNAVTAISCYYDPCVSGASYTQPVTSSEEGFLSKLWNSAKKGDVGGIIDNTKNAIIDTANKIYTTVISGNSDSIVVPVDVQTKSVNQLGVDPGTQDITAKTPVDTGEAPFSYTKADILPSPKSNPDPVNSLSPFPNMITPVRETSLLDVNVIYSRETNIGVDILPQEAQGRLTNNPDFNFDFGPFNDPASYCR